MCPISKMVKWYVKDMVMVEKGVSQDAMKITNSIKSFTGVRLRICAYHLTGWIGKFGNSSQIVRQRMNCILKVGNAKPVGSTVDTTNVLHVRQECTGLKMIDFVSSAQMAFIQISLGQQLA